MPIYLRAQGVSGCDRSASDHGWRRMLVEDQHSSSLSAIFAIVLMTYVPATRGPPLPPPGGALFGGGGGPPPPSGWAPLGGTGWYARSRASLYLSLTTGLACLRTRHFRVHRGLAAWLWRQTRCFVPPRRCSGR